MFLWRAARRAGDGAKFRVKFSENLDSKISGLWNQRREILESFIEKVYE